VRSCWSSYEVVGSGLFIFKEKLKKLKVDLKVWNKEVFGDVNLVSKEVQKRIDVLDARDDDRGLVESEREERKVLLADLIEGMFKQEAVMFQKARQRMKITRTRHSFLNFSDYMVCKQCIYIK